MEEIEVTPGVGPGAYNVFSLFCKDTIGFSAQGLLELAQWVEVNRATLEAEAEADVVTPSKAELYNREMDERNRIITKNIDKPWLPLHDGE